MTKQSNDRQEIPWLHLLRVLACTMVVCLHSLPLSEQYLLTGIDGAFAHLVRIITKPCVPLFFMITGFLILPYNEVEPFFFYKKRIPRVLFPLLIWGVLGAIIFAVYNKQPVNAFCQSLILSPFKNPNVVLWYLYMLIGIYLIIPFISERVYIDKRMMILYLSIWLASSILYVVKAVFPFVREDFILGQNHWEHDFDMIIYFSGYLGYVLLGCAIKQFKCFKDPVKMIVPRRRGG